MNFVVGSKHLCRASVPIHGGYGVAQPKEIVIEVTVLAATGKCGWDLVTVRCNDPTFHDAREPHRTIYRRALESCAIGVQ